MMKNINLDFWIKKNNNFTAQDGFMNLAVEAVDRACLNGCPDKTALIWINHKNEEKKFTFRELETLSGIFSAGLKNIGVKKGDRVYIYMEKIPENYIAILGIIKCGAIACPLFSGFGKKALLERIKDSEGSYIITTGKICNDIIDIALQIESLKGIIIYGSHLKNVKIDLNKIKIIEYSDLLSSANGIFIEKTQATDYALMHYTSGTTGKPKGAVHHHAAILSHRYSSTETFKFEDNDIYWCTADPGWITGTSYGIFGPWSLGVTQLVYEGGFDPEKWYEIIDKYGVNILYTSPTAIRQLMRETEIIKKYSLKSLKKIYSVGEPLNPEAIQWAEANIGLPIYDTWFQTETGAIMITNRPGIAIKPGSMGKPLDGVKALIVDDDGRELKCGETGNLVLVSDFPSLFTSYWQKKDVYDSRFKNRFYFTGDRARVDDEGYFWFVSRNDDVMNVSGHLLGPFEVESALLELPEIVESAVIGIPDVSLGEIPIVFIVLNKEFTSDKKLEMKIKAHIRFKIAAYAVPHKINFIDKLPKTRSGKIMRRMLKNLELGLPIGDTSTLEE